MKAAPIVRSDQQDRHWCLRQKAAESLCQPFNSTHFRQRMAEVINSTQFQRSLFFNCRAQWSKESLCQPFHGTAAELPARKVREIQRSFQKHCRDGRKSGILSYSGMQWCLNFQLPWQRSPQALKVEYLGNNSTAVLSCWRYDRKKGTNLAKHRSRVRTSHDRKLTRELRLWEATRMTRRSPWMPRKGL